MNMTFSDINLTIYNDDFAVVRESLTLNLAEGVNDIVYDRATLSLEPDSVILRDSATGVLLPVLEQTYRNDPVSEGLLLSLFEGQTIEFVLQEVQKPDRRVQGKIIRSGYQAGNRGSFDRSQAIIEVDGKIQFGLPGQPIFPNLGDGTILRPTLGWKIGVERGGEVGAEVGYITSGLSWSASYNVISPEKGGSSAFLGWITMRNTTGRNFESAGVKLLAGDVQKLSGAREYMAETVQRPIMAFSAPAAVEQKEFDDFHLYTLPRKLDLKDRETKQVEFLRAADVDIQTLYIYDGLRVTTRRFFSGMPYLNADVESMYSNDVIIVREFVNTKENKLGMPLPAGRIRFYRQDDQDGSLQFVGEDEIEHTPRGETVRIVTGTAFDLVAERKRTDFKVDNANKTAAEKFSIVLKNRKSESVTIRVVEHAFRWANWKITENSLPFEKINSDEFRFEVELAPDEEKTLTYTIHYSW